MNKINFHDLKRVDAEDFLLFQENINKSLEVLGESVYGVIKKGLSLSILDEETLDTEEGEVIRVRVVECSPGFGFSPSGKFMNSLKTLSVDIFPHIEEEDEDMVYYLYLEYKRENGKECVELKSDINFLLEKDYFPDIFLNKDILILGFVENGVIYPLNREENIPNFSVGETILYLGKFRDYITLRGCRALKEYQDLYIKMDGTSGLPKRTTGESYADIKENELTITLNEKNIPSFGSSTGHNISGKTKANSGGHNHLYEDFRYWVNGRTSFGTDGRICDSFWSTRGAKRKETAETKPAGKHNHEIYARYQNSRPTPIKLEPSYFSTNLIIREY